MNLHLILREIQLLLFSSGQCALNGSLRKWLMSLFLLFCSLFMSQNAMARYAGQDFTGDPNRFNAECEAGSGYVKITVLYYWEDCIASTGDAHIDNITLSYGSSPLCKISYGDAGRYSFSSVLNTSSGIISVGGEYGKGTIVSNSVNASAFKSDGKKKYIELYFYPNNLSEDKVKILYGTWHYYYAKNYTNNILAEEKNINWNGVTNASPITLDSCELDFKNKQTIIYGTRIRKYAIDMAGAERYSLSPEGVYGYISQNVERTIKYKYTVQGIKTEAISYTSKYSYKAAGNLYGHTYECASSTYKVPAFIYPTEAKAIYNSEKKVVDVSWKTPGVSGTAGIDYLNYGYIVKRKAVGSDVWEKVFETNDVNVKSFVDESFVKSADVNSSYVYRVESQYLSKKNYTGDNYTQETKPVLVSTSHLNVCNLELDIDSAQAEVTLNWNVSGSMWASGSSFTIVRRNTQTKKDEVLAEFTDSSKVVTAKSNEGVLSGSFVDDGVVLCTQYLYKIYVTAGTAYGNLGSLISDTILLSEIGRITNINCSKGYYPDRTEINWTAKGGFEVFVVERKLVEESDAFYKQIATVVPNKVQENYMYEDKTCIPGKVYVYRVYGKKDCGNKTPISNILSNIGFRTPTGEFNGRVTFENGQSVDSVEVYLDSEETLASLSVRLNKAGLTTTVPQLIGANALTFQAWMTLSENTNCTVTLGNCSFALGNEGKVSLKDAERSAEFNLDSLENAYYHVTAIYSPDYLAFFLNGKLVGVDSTATTVANTSAKCVIGDGFVGNIDEVRIWSKALSANEIRKDYSRYLVGNEHSLVCYYTFNFLANGACFDMSHTSTDYNGNDGVLGVGATASDWVPSELQLAYKGMTDASGTYSIRSVPFYGNGTAYSLTPRKGSHQFSPTQEVRLISASVQSHTVNFTDNSSFPVSGIVCYSGGTYPVEGVQFTIDGVPALSNTGEYIVTDADGKFAISVPVGVHEVKAVKNGHTFELDGRICNSDGSNRNYQDIISGLKLFDNTKVKYIGRICGGTVQEAYPVGFSLSKNNLADDMQVVLSSTRPEYSLQTEGNVHTDTTAHAILSGVLKKNKNAKALTSITEFNKNDVTIHVNNTTGEFVAWVYPIEYNVNLSVYGHDGIMGDNSSLDLSPYALSKYETYEYQDSVFANGRDSLEGYKLVTITDTVDYIQKQVFTKRYRAKMEVTPLAKSGRELKYFGAKDYTFCNLKGEKSNVPLYNESEKQYLFGLPVFMMNETYNLRYDVFEEYPYYVDNKMNVDADKTDRVAVDEVDVAFINKLAYSSEIDTVNRIYSFKVGEPDMTTAMGTIAATFTYGDSDNPTSVSWENPLGNENGEAYIFGSHQTGTNFVTGGPNKMLCVLRDPPGSNSYSYLEKGTSFTQSSTYTGSFNQEGSESWATGYLTKTESITLANAGTTSSGTANVVVGSSSGIEAGIVHEEEYTGSNSKTTNVTLTTRIQTSEDPIYDGANGDVYVGYSTNISFGSTNSVVAVPIALYDSVGGDGYYEQTYAKANDFVIVKTKGVSALENFNTMFAYPQVYIEQTLLPNLEDLRNSLLVLPAEAADDSTMQKKADSEMQNYYVSLVANTDSTFGQEGSYKVFYSKNIVKSDTIHYLNQAIERWQKAMSDNDSIKASAHRLLQNYSFQAGANIEYSESYSSNLASSHSFSVKVGVSLNDDSEVDILGVHSKFEYNEEFSTTQGGEFANEAEASHSKGFVLAEDGDDDYLSVDVLYEDPNFDETYVNSVGAGSADTSKLQTKDFYPTFVFRTRGGATSCPYEDAYKAVHWKGHEDKVISAATMKLEEPSIDMPKKFIENVPSGEDAYLTVYLKNNSETGEDQWFDLRIVDASNPYGAVPSIDGNSMSGFALEYLVPAGDVLEKTIAITKGSVLNYDNLGLVLASKCQADPTGFLDVIADTVFFSVHFIPSCSDVSIVKPTNNWTYNTNCATDTIDGVERHYMPITISGFDVNYSDFEHLELQYKPASASDNEWITLGYYYKEDSLAQKAVNNGFNAFTISSEDAGNIYYNFYMDNLPDQKYDLRAVSFCNINNELYDNPSVVISGIKDMYNPRLFGAPKPANGVLTIEDDIRIDFNETIAEGMLTVNNFEVTGIRNGAASSHDVAIALDGENDYLVTEATRNFANKDLTFECWVNFDSLQNATFFSHGNSGESIEMGMNTTGNVVVKFAGKDLISKAPAAWEKSSWNHVALVYDNANQDVTAYVNYVASIDNAKVGAYTGNGVVEVGRSVSAQSNYFNGKVDQFRIWDEVRSISTIQANSATQLSGNDLNLIAYYEMDEAKGSATEDKARGANLVMKGGSWALPEGRSASFNGDSYMTMNAASAIITSDMDFTLEFWFNAAAGAKSQTILSTGDGVSDGAINVSNVFSIGFNADGELEFRHNGSSTAVNGDFADNNWHNFTLAVNRSSGIARIYMDGALNTYFPADKVSRLSSDKLYAGARVWHPEVSSVDSIDHYFTGMVDEVRLWKLYRQQSQIESFYNQKVDGDEMGLLLYYPFEHYIQWQGTAEMQFTLADKANANVADAEKVGNVEASTNIPPVKTKGAVSSLLYDWVVNNDALIITLKEQDYRIERSIVNFTVSKVQDVNGNYVVSPVTWSAYISRNQLKWMDDAVSINKKANEPYKFEAQIVNNGGTVLNYNLNNMPSWLSASVESGVINPLQKQTIEFEVDPSLAVGSYDEVIYLTNSNNVTEPLNLNVTVEGNTPNWKVNPSMYQNNMIVYAQLKIDNVFSNDKSDMLAAFNNGECVGVANVTYNKALDMWYAMMTVYSNTESNKLEYRMWDASSGRVLSAVPSVNFRSDSIVGTPNVPVVFSNGTLKYQNIQLNKGWNWVTFNLQNDDDASNLNAYLGIGSWGKNSIVKNMTASANYSVEKMTWFNPKSLEISNQSMFKVYSDVEQTLSVSGADIDLSATEINVNGGSWTYLPYLPTRSMALKAALAGLEAQEGDVIKSNEGFAMYYGNEWIGSLASLQPNCGYMYRSKSATAKTFKYPTSATELRSYQPAVATKASAYESNMNIVAYVPEKADDDVVRAFVGDAQNEVVEVTLNDSYALQFINLSGKAGDVVRFTLEHDGVTYEATSQMSFVGDKVCGTPGTPVVLNFNVNGATESLVAYPNPVVDVLNISGVVTAGGEATIELIDVAGRVVYTASVVTTNNVMAESINMSGLASGSYVLKVTQNNEVKTFKVVKK
ncbi:MAG: T9SS type A sorting domain-containing protein [Paludibacteraceae bacterium]|nr:T9SS type A sorting domain-containing protein [Paludibacteraceae bacterium]